MSVIETVGQTESAAPERQVMTGGQALVESIRREGVDTVFGLPGVQLDAAWDALYEVRDAIRLIHTRHEQATAYMATGFAKVTGREGVCFVVPGPGLLNATGALSTAYACNTPVLAMTGQIQSDLIGFGRGLLHEIPNQLEMIRSVTKHSARAMTPAEIPGVVDEAFRQMRTGRPRPVEIEIPQDVLYATGEVELLPPTPPRPRPAGDPALIEQAAKLLGTAKQPVIHAGGGIHGAEAWEELLALAEMLQAPVVMTQNGRGAVSDRHYLAQNLIGGQSLLQNADVILAVGTRFVDPSTSVWRIGPNRTVIQLDIDPAEIGRNYPVTVRLEADAKAGLAALAARVGRYSGKRPSRKAELTAHKRAVAERVNAVHPQADLGLAVRAALPDEGILVTEVTQVAYWANVGYPIYRPRTYITPGYQGTLGFGFTTALGAKIGRPDVPVVSINGDGGFGFTLNELATMAQHQIAVVAVVFNDDAYGNVKRIQEDQFDGHVLGSVLQNPDYRKLAASFGISARRVETPAALTAALGESFMAAEPTLIEMPVGRMPNVWKTLGLR